jgi:hypothetical protein
MKIKEILKEKPHFIYDYFFDCNFRCKPSAGMDRASTARAVIIPLKA